MGAGRVGDTPTTRTTTPPLPPPLRHLFASYATHTQACPICHRPHLFVSMRSHPNRHSTNRESVSCFDPVFLLHASIRAHTREHFLVHSRTNSRGFSSISIRHAAILGNTGEHFLIHSRTKLTNSITLFLLMRQFFFWFFSSQGTREHFRSSEAAEDMCRRLQESRSPWGFLGRKRHDEGERAATLV